MTAVENYNEKAAQDARDTLDEFVDEAVKQWHDNGEVSTDLSDDYPDGDSWRTENYEDKEYTLREAADLLDDLQKDIETDSGLWERLQPRETISAQAMYTYSNAVAREFRELVAKLNNTLSEIDITPSEGDALIAIAGEKLIRMFVLFDSDEDGDIAAMETAALEGVKIGDYTPATALVDLYGEKGEDRKSVALSRILK